MRGAIPPCTLPQSERPRAFPGVGGGWLGRAERGREPLVVIACVRGVSVADQAAAQRNLPPDPPRLPGRLPRAFWRRPEAYLDSAVRGAISSFALVDPDHVRRGLARLADDLRSGRWEARHGALRECESLDLGYRLVVAERA